MYISYNTKKNSFCSLEYLNLNLNKIDRIKFPSSTSTDKTALFPMLHQLHISENHISEVINQVFMDNINRKKCIFMFMQLKFLTESLFDIILVAIN